MLKTRLWLYNLETGQLAYQDEYCENCVLTAALPAHARSLVEHPQFGSRPDAQPSYCAQGAAPVAQPLGPVFLTVYGEGKHKQAIHAALRAQLEASGRAVMAVGTETTHYSKELLQSIVTGQQNARVLMAEMRGEGKVGVFLYDQNTAINDGKVVSCDDCDREQLVTKIKETTSALMDRCFGASCAGTPSTLRPAEACEPFPAEECPASELLLPSVSGASEQDRITPRTAKIVKGVAWGLFAASAATALGLFIADAADIGNQMVPGGFIDHSLTRPALATTGFTALSLVGAIPLTILMDRGKPSSKATAQPKTEQVSLIQCPN